MGKQQYGNNSEATGRSSEIDKHPGIDPKGASEESFSSMRKVDLKEHHEKTIANMSAQPKHIASMPIDKNHNYRKQSHAVRPSGPIQSFVGNRVDGDMSSSPTIKKPIGVGAYKKDKKG